MLRKKHVFHVKGMTCASCVSIVENSIKQIDGVDFVSVNLTTEKAHVLSKDGVDFEQIKNAVRKRGYSAIEKPPAHDELGKDFRTAKENMLISLVLTIPLMVLMTVNMFITPLPHILVIEVLTAGIVLFYTGRGSIKGAWIAVSHFHTNMDTLVVLGAFASWLTAAAALYGMDVVSFGTISSMIICLHLTGRFIESRLKQRAWDEVKGLLSFAPDEVLLKKKTR